MALDLMSQRIGLFPGMLNNMMDLGSFRQQYDRSIPQRIMPGQQQRQGTMQEASGGGGGGGAWDSAWERRARKILGSSNVGTAEDLKDPEHRKWINRKLRKNRQNTQMTTPTPPKPAEAANPPDVAKPPEPKKVETGPIVKPGQIAKALRPRRGRQWDTGTEYGGEQPMAPTYPGQPTRGLPYA